MKVAGPAAFAQSPPVRAEGRATVNDRVEESVAIELVLAGETAAFRRLVRAHQSGVYGLLSRLCGNSTDAEELTQEAFLKAFRALHRYDPTYRFSTWIYRIALNTFHDHAKSARRREVPTDSSVLAGWAATHCPESDVARAQRNALLSSAIAALPSKYREILVLKDVEGLSYEEIGQIIRLPLTTLKIRVVRARAMLRSQLEKGGGLE
ncbi:MAG: sigma-70 family RNA polymerase sigma factor [Deltaproteobacteria bacterium]|nr:sigma-70 family RNA polymerase sigma factor [Deltaproteobacteria bacterium]